jgi:dTDP-4-amino-4,6-dideoxy-D-galactose acyltransferase
MSNYFSQKEWDSQFFKRKIFSLELPTPKLKKHDWPTNSLITIKASSSDYLSLNAISEYCFSFIEGELVFKKNVRPNIETPLSFENHIANNDSIEELKCIVSNLYINSRFREPWFSAQERDSFYQKWVENAVLSRFDDCCLVIKNDDAISGFVTVRVQEEEATVGLIGVASPWQGQGLGKKLLELVESYCIAKKAKVIKVATQTSNISAANLYCKNGFAIADISYWFYKQV